MKTIFVRILQFPLLVSAAAAQVKFGGGGAGDVLLPAFLNSDKTWYQDARQAYHGEDFEGADGPLAKMEWRLLLATQEWANYAATNPGQPYQHADPLFPIANARLLVEVICENNQAWQQVEPAMTTAGATSINRDSLTITAWMPHDTIGGISQMAGVRQIRPSYRATRAGAVVSQGDAASSADLARALVPGFTGAGITVGTLSDSFARAAGALTSATQDVANGEIPADTEVLLEFGAAATDEGRAMMQIIADLAPGADQKFFTAFNGQAAFANGIRALAAAGCDVIVDDIFYFAEPFFQNGLVAQAVNEVTATGVVYLSAAGNSGRDSYESPFRPATGFSGLSGGPLHDFDPGTGVDVFQSFTIPVGSSLTFSVQWDQPFFSVSGAPGCASDLDVFLTGSGAGQSRVLTGGFASNVGGDALEIFTFSNNGTINIDGIPGPDTQFNLAFEHFAGPAPGLVKVLFFDNGPFTINQFATNSSTLVGHANAESALGIAAAPFFGTPRFGINPPQPESFTSPGGTPLLFDDNNDRKAQPLLTGQPRVTAPDGGNTTFFGQDIGGAADPDTFPNFFGTSAAAPHAAAVVALMLEKSGGPGSLTPAQVDAILRATALDMGAPGVDEVTGAGIVVADAALAATPLGFPAWRRREFPQGGALIGAAEDFDGDGLKNALEFYLGRNPRTPDIQPPLAISRSQDSLLLQVQVSPEVDASRGRIQSSTDLLKWTPRPDLAPGSGLLEIPLPARDREFFQLAVDAE